MKDSGVQHRCWRMKKREQATGLSFFRLGKLCADSAVMTSR